MHPLYLKYIYFIFQEDIFGLFVLYRHYIYIFTLFEYYSETFQNINDSFFIPIPSQFMLLLSPASIRQFISQTPVLFLYPTFRSPYFSQFSILLVVLHPSLVLHSSPSYQSFSQFSILLLFLILCFSQFSILFLVLHPSPSSLSFSQFSILLLVLYPSHSSPSFQFFILLIVLHPSPSSRSFFQFSILLLVLYLSPSSIPFS